MGTSGRSVGGDLRPQAAGGGRPWAAVLHEVAADRVDRVVFVAAVLVVGFGDSLLLPFDFTQRLALANWDYFDARYAAFTVAFALSMAWVITLQVHATKAVAARARAGASRRGGLVGAVAAVVSLLPSFLCCSPIVPTLVGLLGLSATTQLRTTGRIEYFFATKQDLLLLGSLALVVASGLWSMRTLARAACLGGECPAGCGEPERPDQEDEPCLEPVGEPVAGALAAAAPAEEARR